MYCKKCQINWQTLWSEDDQTLDETYELCPMCRSTLDLEPQLPGDTFLYILGGGIINFQTKEPWRDPKKITPAPPVRPPFDLEAYKTRMQENDIIKENAIDAYSKAISGGSSQQEAEKIYFEILHQQKTHS